MPPTSMSAVVRQARELAVPADTAAASDVDLLDRFRATGEEAAFGALVRRHGPLVMGVCRRVLRHHQDAEDAFQATFLVLARKAASIHRRAALVSWLYGVARRVASEARSAAARRQARERRATNVVHAQPELEAAWRELQAVLAQEVERLPEKYQLPFVLCCLEGRSKAEAAAQLGYPAGTVSSRLAEARKRMQGQLARRGLTLTAALGAVAATAATASALSSALLTTTVSAALGARAGAAADVSARVAALANGATKAMFASKVKAATALLLAVGLLASAVAAQLHQTFADPPAGEGAPLAQPDKAPAAKPNNTGAPVDAVPAGGVLRLGATGLRHDRGVGQMVLSPGGTRLAAYGLGYLSLWDTRTGTLVRKVGLASANVRASLVWLPDGRGIAALQGDDGWVWEFTDDKVTPRSPRTEKLAAEMAFGMPTDHESDWCYAVSPDGKTLAIGRGGKRVKNVGMFNPLVVPIGQKEIPDTARPILLRPLKTGAAIELLEAIATPAARDVLSQLANGAAEAPLTIDAMAALKRLRRR